MRVGNWSCEAPEDVGAQLPARYPAQLGDEPNMNSGNALPLRNCLRLDAQSLGQSDRAARRANSPFGDFFHAYL